MSNSELLDRIARLERSMARWRIATLALGAILVSPLLVSPAHALDRFLSVVDLSASTVTASKIRASDSISTPELSVSRITILDHEGKVRGTLGVKMFSSDEVELSLQNKEGTRSSTLSVDKSDSRLTLWAGSKHPTLSAWASTNELLPAGLFISDSETSRIKLELSGGSNGIEPWGQFALSGPDGKSRVFISEGRDGGYAAFSSKFGSIELDRSFQLAEPVLRLRSRGSGKAAIELGIRSGEPTATFKNAAGDVVWEPTLKKVRPAVTPAKKDATTASDDPL